MLCKHIFLSLLRPLTLSAHSTNTEYSFQVSSIFSA